MKIVAIENNMGIKELEKDISKINFEGTDCFCNVVHTFNHSRENSQLSSLSQLIHTVLYAEMIINIMCIMTLI